MYAERTKSWYNNFIFQILGGVFMLTKNNTIEIPSFQTSIYNIEVTENDTIEEVYGIIARKLGEQYKSWFTFSSILILLITLENTSSATLLFESIFTSPIHIFFL